MKLYQIRVDIYEAATAYRYPVVTHLFHGRTKDEAQRYHRSHLKSDAFLRACEAGRAYRGVRCVADTRARWVRSA